MLLKVGVRFSVGPVTLDSDSSHPRLPSDAHTTTSIPAYRHSRITLSSLGGLGILRFHDQGALHVLMAIATVLGTQDRKTSGLAGGELDHDWHLAAGDFFFDLELLDLDPVHAVSRAHGKRDALADCDFDL